MNSYLVKVKGLYKSFDVKPAPISVLKGIDLEIKPGELTIIFGQSGSGKSTLINTILGLELPTKGEVRIGDWEITKMKATEVADVRKDHVGIVYQQPYWIKSLDVLGNVAFPLTLKGYTKLDSYRKALEMLQKLGIAERSNFQPTELSAGQQQKVSLSRALISNPEIIVADEPTGNLDYKSGQELTELLSKLAKEGRTVMMVTHELANLDYADRIIRIHDGLIVEDINVNKDIKEIKKKLISNEDIKKTTVITDSKVVEDNGHMKISDKFKIQIPTRETLKNFAISFYELIRSIILAIISLSYRVIDKVLSFNLMPNSVKNYRYKISNFYYRVASKIDKTKDNEINYPDLFDLSFKNLFSKKNRALITVGGVALGIAFTTFLISLGFGLEKLVISEAAELEQQKQADVLPPPGESVQLTDETISILESFDNVETVNPIISIAGNVSYEGSTGDAVVSGVQTQYLEKSDINLVSGDFFKSNELVVTNYIGETEEANELADNALRKAVVNDVFIDLIGLSESSAPGKFIDLSFIFSYNNLNESELIETNRYAYEVVGVINEGDSAQVYLPLIDTKSLGITEYSELRITAESKDDIPDLRRSIEGLGYRTKSIQDTIQQIEDFFGTARIIFAVVGSVALFVASLGMFNTLTVSLLERIREVGLMKAMGMKSKEIQAMFITEALIMGIIGGVLGIVLGLIVGNLGSLFISIIAIFSGGRYLNFTYLPLTTAFLVFLVAALTGVVTGFYPARRATNISPLDALRYE